MPPSSNHPAQPHHQSGEFEARILKVMLEFRELIDERLEKNRTQTKEDIKVAVMLGVGPLDRKIDQLDTAIKTVVSRLDDGNRRFEDQSSRISRALETASTAAAAANDAKVQMLSASGRALPLQAPEGEQSSKMSVKEIIGFIGAIGGLLAIVLSGWVALYKVPSNGPGSQPPTSSTPASP